MIDALTMHEVLRIAAKAVQMHSETHPRPPHVSQVQVGQIDRIIEARKVAA